MSWKIDIILKREADGDADKQMGGRYDYGKLIFRTESGFRLECPCRGMGLKNLQKPGADGKLEPNWNKTGGNTPTGSVIGHLCPADLRQDDKYKPPTAYIYGPHQRIVLDKPINGNFKKAYKEHDRAGIQIHGGRSQEKLWNTEGCIRVFNDDMGRIVDKISAENDPDGVITITEEERYCTN